MRLFRLSLVALAANICISTLPVQAADNTLPPAAAREIEQIVSNTIEAEGIPGLSVSVRSAAGNWFAAFGQADLENKIAVDHETRFRLASISKPITAVAVMQLVEQGKVDLDAPVRTYVPEWKQKYSSPLANRPWPVTARQLLGHLAGVRHYLPQEVTRTFEQHTPLEALSIFNDSPLLQEPGTKFSYSTHGYTLLGCIVEKVSGQSFVDYCQEHIFETAEMQSIRVYDWESRDPSEARGYRRAGNGEMELSLPPDTRYKIPGGGLCATADDLSRFSAALLAGRLLNPRTRDLMFRPLKLKDLQTTNYGLGWNIKTRGDGLLISQSGGQQGVAALLSFATATGVSVAVMANVEEAQTTTGRIPDLKRLTERLMDVVEETPAEFATIDGTLKELYGVISGPAGQKRDWDRMRSLFIDGARLIPTYKNRRTGRSESAVWSVDEYISRNGEFLESNGFFEREISRRTRRYGNMADVFSTYVSFHNSDDTVPFARGINSIQMMFDGTRWWIVTVFWQGETDDQPIPDRFLPQETG